VKDLESLVKRLLAEIASSADLSALDSVRVAALGKKGGLTELLKGLGRLPADERKAAGASINSAKESITAALDARRAELEAASLESELRAGAIDVTLPGRGQPVGGLHPVTRTRLRIEAIFRRAGFSVAEGPESRTTTTTSRRSTSPPTTRRARCTTPSTLATASCCGPTPRRCRSGR
jgi:phenylalanyl-tRNA synthetase alpha chain